MGIHRPVDDTEGGLDEDDVLAEAARVWKYSGGMDKRKWPEGSSSRAAGRGSGIRATVQTVVGGASAYIDSLWPS